MNLIDTFLSKIIKKDKRLPVNIAWDKNLKEDGEKSGNYYETGNPSKRYSIEIQSTIGTWLFHFKRGNELVGVFSISDKIDFVGDFSESSKIFLNIHLKPKIINFLLKNRDRLIVDEKWIKELEKRGKLWMKELPKDSTD